MNGIARTKIHSRHLGRRAAIYVRQSTPGQVKRHTASTKLQYDLADRATSFGWTKAQCTFYDEDLGVSGSKPGERHGFAQLVTDVALGIIGIIFAFDVTRLARNNTDWHRLLDMCSICSTLVADLDGTYDVAQYNDRLLLGLKGTMSEAEHHLIRTRLVEGMEKKAREGSLRKRLPVGLDYDVEGNVVLNPDESIRHAIELVFDKFRELGTAHQVYRYLQAEDLRVPVRRYKWDDVRWERPNYDMVRRILTNPRYAGAYVYGRTKVTRTVDENGSIRETRTNVEQEEWKVVLRDHHPGYVSWDEFEANRARLQKNVLLGQTTEASEVRRNGRGLLQGLVRCGICGRRMYTSYPTKGDAVRYICQKKARSTDGVGVCQSFSGTRLEDTIIEAFFDALAPASAQVAVDALGLIDSQEDAVLQQLRDQLQEARYRADRARRQFDVVEPENRNVARTLERTWNEKLQRVAEIEAKIDERQQHVPVQLSDDERARVLRLGVDLQRVWDAPTTEHRDRKRALQIVLEGIFVQLDRETRHAHVTLAWVGGATTELDVHLPGVGHHTRVTDESVIEDIRRMAMSMTDKEIANTLLRRSIRTAHGLPFSAQRVRTVRRLHGIAAYDPRRAADDGEETVTASQAANELGLSKVTVLRWIEKGLLHGEQVAPSAPWRVRIPERLRVRSVDEAPRGSVPLRKAARALGVDTSDVVRRVLDGELEAVFSGSGRRRRLCVNLEKRRDGTAGPLFDGAE